MTNEQLALLNQLPAAWQEVVLDYEAQTWIEQRKSFLAFTSKIRKDGGHMMLKDDLVDPDALPEPLQSRVKAMLERSPVHL